MFGKKIKESQIISWSPLQITDCFPPNYDIKNTISLFKLQAIFEGFSHSFAYLIITMRVRIKSNGIYQIHINLIFNHDTFICGDIHHFTDHTASIFIILIFDKFTL